MVVGNVVELVKYIEVFTSEQDLSPKCVIDFQQVQSLFTQQSLVAVKMQSIVIFAGHRIQYCATKAFPAYNYTYKATTKSRQLRKYNDNIPQTHVRHSFPPSLALVMLVRAAVQFCSCLHFHVFSR